MERCCLWQATEVTGDDRNVLQLETTCRPFISWSRAGVVLPLRFRWDANLVCSVYRTKSPLSPCLINPPTRLSWLEIGMFKDVLYLSLILSRPITGSLDLLGYPMIVYESISVMDECNLSPDLRLIMERYDKQVDALFQLTSTTRKSARYM